MEFFNVQNFGNGFFELTAGSYSTGFFVFKFSGTSTGGLYGYVKFSEQIAMYFAGTVKDLKNVWRETGSFYELINDKRVSLVSHAGEAKLQ